MGILSVKTSTLNVPSEVSHVTVGFAIRFILLAKCRTELRTLKYLNLIGNYQHRNLAESGFIRNRTKRICRTSQQHHPSGQNTRWPSVRTAFKQDTSCRVVRWNRDESYCRRIRCRTVRRGNRANQAHVGSGTGNPRLPRISPVPNTLVWTFT